MDKKSQIRELIVYLIVGVLTTIVSWLACYVAKFFLDSSDSIQNFIINTIGWIVGVCFSYPLSRKWVFRSTNPKVIKEFLGFAGSRLSTWIMDLLIMWLFVNVFTLNWAMKLASFVIDKFGLSMSLEDAYYWVIKILISAVIVTIANYIFSKVLIFRKKKPETDVNENN